MTVAATARDRFALGEAACREAASARSEYDLKWLTMYQSVIRRSRESGNPALQELERFPGPRFRGGDDNPLRYRVSFRVGHSGVLAAS
jgi:hypothetical protein